MCKENNMKLKLFNWNVNSLASDEEQENEKIEICNFLKDKKENLYEIVILQEVNRKFYYKLKKELGEEYKFFNGYFDDEYPTGHTKFLTVIIMNNDTRDFLNVTQIMNYGTPLNRYVKLNIIFNGKELNLLGIHSDDGASGLINWLKKQGKEKPVEINDIELFCLKSKDEIKKKDLIAILDKYNFNPHIMIGDFNAGNYIKAYDDYKISENRENYQILSNGYFDVVQGKYTTKYKTQIDHILIKNTLDFGQKFNIKNAKVRDEINFSDHYPITCEIHCR